MPAIPTNIPLNQVDTSLTTFTIKVDGEAIPATYNVLSIDICQTINQISFARILLYDGDAAKQDFEISGSDVLEPGRTMEIFAGYHLDESSLYKGIIIRQKIKVKRSGGSLLYLEVRDKVFKMTLDRKSRYFKDLSDSDLFNQIADEYGISMDSDLTGETHPEVIQYQVSDWDFIVSRAERLGAYCLFLNDKMLIKKMTPTPTASFSLSYGVDIYDADLEMESRSQFESVIATAWDYTNQELLNADVEDVSSPAHGNPNGQTLSAVGGVSTFNLKHSGHLSQQDLDAWAEAQMIKSRFARIRGTIKIQGNAGVLLTDSVELKGFGSRFNGNAFVSGIRHNIGDGNWTTTLQIGNSPEWHVEKYPVSNLPAAGFNPSISGLHIGVVTQLQDDPNGEHRIQVKIPIIDNDDQGTWCRVALPDAGENRGMVWLPEISDEVIVGFINDDPNHPVILGMLHSSAKPSPHTASDENQIKGIVSRSDMRITFDDENKILSLETPKGNKITLNEDGGSILLEDENSNKISMSAEGIILESSKDLVIKASGDIQIEGINIKNEASAGFEAKGGGSAKLSSSGSTDVKGSIVNIN